MSPSLVIFGGGSLARMAYEYFSRDSEYEVTACTVNSEYVDSTSLHGLPVVAFEELAHSYPPDECALFVAVGYSYVNRRRAEIFARGLELGYELPTLISFRSHCWDDLQIGRNCLLFDGVVVEPNVRIGDDVIAWSGSQISHDSTIGDHCFLGPHAVVLGNVTIGARCFLGGNATVRDGLQVADDSVIGAATIVKTDTAPGDVYAAENPKPLSGRDAREQVDL